MQETKERGGPYGEMRPTPADRHNGTQQSVLKESGDGVRGKTPPPSADECMGGDIPADENVISLGEACEMLLRKRYGSLNTLNITATALL